MKRRVRMAGVGAGAVGCYFGGMLARAGAAVTLIGRAGHVDAINRDGLFLEVAALQEEAIAIDRIHMAGPPDQRYSRSSTREHPTEIATHGSRADAGHPDPSLHSTILRGAHAV